MEFQIAVYLNIVATQRIKKPNYFPFYQITFQCIFWPCRWKLHNPNDIIIYFFPGVDSVERHFLIRVLWQNIYEYIVVRSPTNANFAICDFPSRVTSIGIWEPTNYNSSTNKYTIEFDEIYVYLVADTFICQKMCERYDKKIRETPRNPHELTVIGQKIHHI